MLESTNPLKSHSALQSASIQDNSFAPETDLTTLNLSGSSQSLNNEVLTSDFDAQQNPNPSPYISSPAVFADFNGDGIHDKFWRNTTTGENAVWLMDGATPTGAVINTMGTEWNETIGDFNGDGKTDLMWRNGSTGENLLWLMDGSTIVSEAALDTLGTEWDYSIADFNGDSKTDLLWRNNTTGENAGWLMDGVSVSGADFLPQLDSSWTCYRW